MKKHNPKHLSQILSSFSKNNNIIKYTTHNWDFGSGERTFNTIEEFTEEVKAEWLKHSSIINQLRPSLVKKYEAFLFDTNHTKWGRWGIEFGWSSNELKEEDRDPHYKVLPQKYRRVINNRSMDRFKDVIELFKQEIALPYTAREFRILTREIIKGVTKNYKIKFENIEYEQIETDVEGYVNGLKLMVGNFQKVSEEAEVEIETKKTNNPGEIEIYLSLKAEKNKKQIKDHNYDETSKIYKEIKRELTSVCDWEVEVNEELGQVTHKMKFYRY